MGSLVTTDASKIRVLDHAEIVRPSLDVLNSYDRFPITILLDNIRSAQNVGSILRTADAVRAREVVMTGITPDATHKGALKASLGAEQSVPWRVESDPERFLREFKRSGGTVAILEITDSPTLIESINTQVFPICMIVGSEIKGVSESLVRQAHMALEIPQFGFKQSLNVSVATGIALYQLLQTYFRLHPDERPPLSSGIQNEI